MKKNLLALLVLVVLVAVVAQFTRHSGKKPEWVALEKDIVASLELLWQLPGQSVELREVEGGAQALVTVRMPGHSRGDWNYALVRFVAERHPTVKLQEVKVREAADQREVPEGVAHAGPAAAERRSELMRRQAQAALRGRGLLLVDVREIAPAPPAPVELRIQREVEAPPGPPPEKSSGKAYLPVTRAAVPQIQIHACLVVLPEVSPEEIGQALKSLNPDPNRGHEMRLIKLPWLNEP